MMDRSTENLLIEALDALEAGDSVETILRRYPADEARLRPMLITARAARRLYSEPSPSAQARSRAAFLAQAAAKRAEISARPTRRPLIRLPLIQMMSILLVIISVGALAVFLSQSALPDSPLYALKRGVEAARLTLASGANREALQARFNAERLREVGLLLENGDEAEVMFSGSIQAISDETWQVAGLPVQVDKSTLIRGIAAVGEVATITGYTRDGVLTAITIDIGGTFEPLPDPDKVVPSPTPLIKDPPSTRTPAPPRATPTFQSPPPDNGNENENENENENDNNSGSGNSGSGGGGDNDNGNDND